MSVVPVVITMCSCGGVYSVVQWLPCFSPFQPDWRWLQILGLLGALTKYRVEGRAVSDARRPHFEGLDQTTRPREQLTICAFRCSAVRILGVGGGFLIFWMEKGRKAV